MKHLSQESINTQSGDDMNKRELKLITMLIKMIYACGAMNDNYKYRIHNEVENFFMKNYNGKFLKYIYDSEEFDKMYSKTITSIK